MPNHEAKYNRLMAQRKTGQLTAEDRKFVQQHALSRIKKLFADPDVGAVLHRLKDK